MPSVADLITKLTNFKSELINQMPAVSKEMAGVALSYTLAGLRKTGVSTEKVAAAKYSEKGVPAYFYAGFSNVSTGKTYANNEVRLNAGFDRLIKSKLKKKGKEGLVTWKEIRAAQGLQTAVVDLTYSGRMLQNTGPIGYKTNNLIWVTIIGGMNRETKDKLAWNLARYGKFLAVYGKAYDFALLQGGNRITQIYKKFIL